MKCDMNCFVCKFSDCILDAVTSEDIVQSAEIDRENRYYQHDNKTKRNIRYILARYSLSVYVRLCIRSAPEELDIVTKCLKKEPVTVA